MSIEFLRHLNGDANGTLLELIEEYEMQGRQPRIAWYPSAGSDFRGLLYLNKNYATRYPGFIADPEPPDLFLMTDYLGGIDPDWESTTIYRDKQTWISQEWPQEVLPSVDPAYNSSIVRFEGGSGRVTFDYLWVTSAKAGISTGVPVIYVQAVNETFCAKHMLPYKAKISHVIHIRYGGGLGGGGLAAGGWIPGVLERLGAESYITDSRDYIQEGDKAALLQYPSLKPPKGKLPRLLQYRVQDRKYWSDYGDISWCLVRSADSEPCFHKFESYQPALQETLKIIGDLNSSNNLISSEK